MKEAFKEITVEDMDSGIAVVTFNSRRYISEEIIGKLGNELFSLAERQGKNNILLNWENVEFISSLLLAKLIRLNRNVESARGKLVFCSLSEEINEVLNITKLDRLFNIEKDLPSGIASFFF